MHQNRVEVGDIERRVVKRLFVYVADLESHIVVAAGFGRRPRQGDLGFFHVDAVQFPGTYRLGEPERNRPRAASEIEDGLPGLQIGQQTGGMGSRTAPVQELTEVVVIPHGVLEIRRFFFANL